MISLDPNEVNGIDCSNMKPEDKSKEIFGMAGLYFGKWDTPLPKRFMMSDKDDYLMDLGSSNFSVVVPDDGNSSGRWVTMPDRDGQLKDLGLDNFSITFDSVKLIEIDDETVKERLLKWTEADMKPKKPHQVMNEDEPVETLFDRDFSQVKF